MLDARWKWGKGRGAWPEFFAFEQQMDSFVDGGHVVGRWAICNKAIDGKWRLCRCGGRQRVDVVSEVAAVQLLTTKQIIR